MIRLLSDGLAAGQAKGALQPLLSHATCQNKKKKQSNPFYHIKELSSVNCLQCVYNSLLFVGVKPWSDKYLGKLLVEREEGMIHHGKNSSTSVLSLLSMMISDLDSFKVVFQMSSIHL